MNDKIKKFQIKEKFSQIENPPFIYSSSKFNISKKLTGEGVRTSIISSGLPKHEDIKNITDNESFTTKAKNNEDVLGYSTMISGILTANSKNIVGLSPSSELLVVKVYNDNGEFSKKNIVSSILWSIIKGVDIIVFPHELDCKDNLIYDSIKKAYDANICMFSLAQKTKNVKKRKNTEEIFENYTIELVDYKDNEFSVDSSKILKNTEKFYTTWEKTEYTIPPSNILAIGIVSGLAALLIEEKNNSKNTYSPKDIYYKINSILS